jgi:hypothetical protein
MLRNRLNSVDPLPFEVDEETKKLIKKNKQLDARQMMEVEFLPIVNKYLNNAAYLQCLNQSFFSVFEALMPVPPFRVRGAAPRTVTPVALTIGVFVPSTHCVSSPTSPSSASPPRSPASCAATRRRLARPWAARTLSVRRHRPDRWRP